MSAYLAVEGVQSKSFLTYVYYVRHPTLEFYTKLNPALTTGLHVCISGGGGREEQIISYFCILHVSHYTKIPH